MSTRSRTPVFHEAKHAGYLTTTTAASGATWVVLGNTLGGPVSCRVISLHNTTLTELEFGRGTVGASSPTGGTFRMSAGTSYTHEDLTSSAALFVRRTDHSNSQVYFDAEAFK